MIVTIIVILLALLMPAMSKAVYAAQLASCGARQKALGSAIIAYTMENKRTYPDRKLDHFAPGSTQRAWINAMALVRPLDGEGYDLRPPLKPLMDINATLQCPFTQPIDLVNTPDDVGVEASYMMFWGWKYHTGSATEAGERYPGMYRYGDRFEWQGHSFSVLAGDIDIRYPGSAGASHPDRNPSVLFSHTAVDQVTFGRRDSASRWVALTTQRGVLDNNFLFDDNSVRRYNETPRLEGNGPETKDDRFRLAPLQYDDRRKDPIKDRLQLPRQ